MCGIAGFFYPASEPPRGASELLRKMTSALAHRGPDAEGFHEEPGLGLGHRRLKIIDLETGAQPMTSADGRYTLIFNGEIFNFREIRARLESRGRKFRTKSDTESLLQLFAEKGAACLPDLEGMFAFVIWDRERRVLTAAVDAFGKKPFYYSAAKGGTVFASEPRALLVHPDVPREPDRRSVLKYLAFEYVPAPDTIWSGVRKLRGGTALEMSADGGVRVFRYTRPFGPAVYAKTEAGWLAEAQELLRDAVKKRLVSDVPLGVFLSGGLDSTAVLAEMRALDPGRKIKTFTIGFEEASFDESTYARKAADFFSTEHIEEKLTLGAMLREHEAILAHLDEPMADASFIPTFLLSRLVRKHVTVALGGDGGDELFGGYPTFEAARLAGRIDRWAPWAKGALGRAARSLPVSMDNLSLDFKAKQFTKGLLHPARERNQVWLGAFEPKEIRSILAPGLASEAGFGAEIDGVYRGIDEVLGDEPADARDDLQEFYFKFYLEGDILVKTDRASMANSLEARSPLLDDRLVGAVRRIPAEMRFKDGQPKHLFKKMLRGRIPAEILTRPKKGFGIPIAHWIRQDLRREFEAALAPDRVRKDGFFNPEAVSALLAEHLAGKRDNRKQLWTLYVFQKWKETWLG
jgi:asparagine synthase (glutamine-hydrolysing)